LVSNDQSFFLRVNAQTHFLEQYPMLAMRLAERAMKKQAATLN